MRPESEAAPVTLLEPALLARLEALQLGTRRPLAGFVSGEHRSRRHGTSLDFADYRQYHPGDDFRRIDYHLYARLDVLLLKLYEAEEDLHLRLLIDTSASMGMSGKLEMAERVAAALGFVALTRRDPVSVHTFPLDRPAPRFLGRSAVPALFEHLESLEATGTTDFVAATSHLLARPGPPGLTVVLSDLLTPEWEPALSRLPGRGSDVVVVHVLAEDELDPAWSGDGHDAAGPGRRARDQANGGGRRARHDSDDTVTGEPGRHLANGIGRQTRKQANGTGAGLDARHPQVHPATLATRDKITALRSQSWPTRLAGGQARHQAGQTAPGAQATRGMPPSGDLELVDRETGTRVAVSVTGDAMARYRQLVADWLSRVEHRCHQVGATYVRVLAGEPLEAVLLSAWRRRRVLR